MKISNQLSFLTVKDLENFSTREYDHYNLTRVIREVTSFYTEDEDEAEHYFIVEMDGIGEFSVLLDTERIESYVRQVGLYHSKSFSLAINIKGVFEDYGLKISEFPIYIGTKKMNCIQYLSLIKIVFLRHDKNLKIQYPI